MFTNCFFTVITFLKKSQTKLGFLISVFALQFYLTPPKNSSKKRYKVVNRSYYLNVN
jgi:hypothetical protein